MLNRGSGWTELPIKPLSSQIRALLYVTHSRHVLYICRASIVKINKGGWSPDWQLPNILCWTTISKENSNAVKIPSPAWYISDAFLFDLLWDVGLRQAAAHGCRWAEWTSDRWCHSYALQVAQSSSADGALRAVYANSCCFGDTIYPPNSFFTWSISHDLLTSLGNNGNDHKLWYCVLYLQHK